jgi:hypothetical protein
MKTASLGLLEVNIKVNFSTNELFLAQGISQFSTNQLFFRATKLAQQKS